MDSVHASRGETLYFLVDFVDWRSRWNWYIIKLTTILFFHRAPRLAGSSIGFCCVFVYLVSVPRTSYLRRQHHSVDSWMNGNGKRPIQFGAGAERLLRLHFYFSICLWIYLPSIIYSSAFLLSPARARQHVYAVSLVYHTCARDKRIYLNNQLSCVVLSVGAYILNFLYFSSRPHFVRFHQRNALRDVIDQHTNREGKSFEFEFCEIVYLVWRMCDVNEWSRRQSVDKMHRNMIDYFVIMLFLRRGSPIGRRLALVDTTRAIKYIRRICGRRFMEWKRSTEC